MRTTQVVALTRRNVSQADLAGLCLVLESWKASQSTTIWTPCFGILPSLSHCIPFKDVILLQSLGFINHDVSRKFHISEHTSHPTEEPLPHRSFSVLENPNASLPLRYTFCTSSEVEQGIKDQLLDAHSEASLKHCFYCPFLNTTSLATLSRMTWRKS